MQHHSMNSLLVARINEAKRGEKCSACGKSGRYEGICTSCQKEDSPFVMGQLVSHTDPVFEGVVFSYCGLLSNSSRKHLMATSFATEPPPEQKSEHSHFYGSYGDVLFYTAPHEFISPLYGRQTNKDFLPFLDKQ